MKINLKLEITEMNCVIEEEQQYIFRPYITVKGKRITRPNGGMFKIPVKNREGSNNE